MIKIKFRAWDKEEKKMIKNFQDTYLWEDYNNSKKYAVMQYISLKDKNLCQSDIIEFPFEHPITGEVDILQGIIEKDEYGFIVETLDGSSSFSLRELDEVIDKIKKIGNIYKNKELLK